MWALDNNALAPRRGLAVLSLLGGAALWGIVWYPYRKLQEAGVGGALATLATYAVALALASLIQFRAWYEFRRQPWLMLGIALAAGWSIVSYVVAILQAEVVRVLLLFYLAPLWTLPLARVFLGERTPPGGYLVLGIALLGAMLMLWDGRDGLPLPGSLGEWLALSAGFAFACSNIFVRKAQLSGIFAKSMAVWLGTVVIAALACSFEPDQWRALPQQWLATWPLICGIGVAVLLMSLSIQYGFTHLPANQAMIILLFELVVAAAAAYWLAGETLSLRDWIGGAMIVGAGLCSDRLAPHSASVREQRA
jgi:drug/metabolite transporter (DMT)-like permease